MKRTLTPILLIGWKLQTSFWRSVCTLSEACPSNCCAHHRVSPLCLFFPGWTLYFFSGLKWSWLLPAFHFSPHIFFSFLLSTLSQVLNASSFEGFLVYADCHGIRLGIWGSGFRTLAAIQATFDPGLPKNNNKWFPAKLSAFVPLMSRENSQGILLKNYSDRKILITDMSLRVTVA